MYAVILLYIVSIIAFWLSKQVPGDEVMDYISIDDRGYNTSYSPAQYRRSYQRVAHQRGLDLPEFYFTVSPGFIHDSIHLILPYEDRDNVKQWAYQSKNGKVAFILYNKIHSGLFTHCDPPKSTAIDQQLCLFYNQSLALDDVNAIYSTALILQDSLSIANDLPGESNDRLNQVIQSCERLKNSSASIAEFQWIPNISWNGSQNQYHQWMTGLLHQKPLTSLIDGRNAWKKIYDALKWTILLNGFAFLLSILSGVAIGIWSGTHDGMPLEKVINWILFALFALPSFWLGTLFIYFFASGEWLSIFPAGGLGPYQSAGNFFERCGILLSHLFLPVTCLALGSLAYVSRQMKQSVRHEFSQPYIALQRTQGISEKTIVNKHIIRNAIFPVITMIGGAFPALLSGSLIIEVIFSIPGMGRLMYTSLLSRDWPVAFPILMLGAVITILSYMLTDIIYKWADPRVKVLER